MHANFYACFTKCSFLTLSIVSTVVPAEELVHNCCHAGGAWSTTVIGGSDRITGKSKVGGSAKSGKDGYRKYADELSALRTDATVTDYLPHGWDIQKI